MLSMRPYRITLYAHCNKLAQYKAASSYTMKKLCRKAKDITAYMNNMTKPSRATQTSEIPIIEK